MTPGEKRGGDGTEKDSTDDSEERREPERSNDTSRRDEDTVGVDEKITDPGEGNEEGRGGVGSDEIDIGGQEGVDGVKGMFDGVRNRFTRAGDFLGGKWDVFVSKLRALIRRRGRDFTGYQKKLNQAHIDVAYDRYLASVFIYALTGFVLGVLLGVVFTWIAGELGWMGGGTVQILPTGVASLTLALSLGFYRYYKPVWTASRREDAIESGLPYAVVFLYALSEGGLDILEAMRRLSENREIYGEVSDEFAVVVRRTDMMGEELTDSLEKLRETTPSSQLQVFLDDLRGAVSSGGEVTPFLKTETDRFLEYSKKEQEEYLENLSMMGSMYIILFILAPILVIITLMVLQMMGHGMLPALYTLVYVLLPVGMASFIWIIDLVNETPEIDATIGGDRGTADSGPSHTPKIEKYRKWRRRKHIKSVLFNPVTAINDRPRRSLYITTPIALSMVAVYLYQGVSPGNVVNEPVDTTFLLFVAPLLVMLIPLGIFTAVRDRRRSSFLDRFPYKLTTMANTNESGMSLKECIEQVSETSTGYIGKEFRRMQNDIDWSFDIEGAIIRFVNRVKVPEVSRKMGMISESRSASGKLEKILKIAAEDAHARQELRNERNKQMASHIAVIVLGFLVYIGVLITLDVTFVSESADISTAAANDTQKKGMAAASRAKGSFFSGGGQLPANKYRMIFLHAILIQGIGNGFIIGKLSKDNIFSGIKYIIVFVAISMGGYILAT